MLSVAGNLPVFILIYLIPVKMQASHAVPRRAWAGHGHGELSGPGPSGELAPRAARDGQLMLAEQPPLSTAGILQ